MRLSISSLLLTLCVATPALGDADPSIVREGNVYYLVSAPSMEVRRSTDLQAWTPVGTRFSAPAWTTGTLRSPRLYADGGRAWLYYTADKKGGGACIGVATGDSLEGAWKDHGALVCTQKGAHFGSIDPFVLAERGVRYLVWKENGDEGKKPSWLLFQELGKDGVSLKDVAHELIDNDTKWEGTAIRCPSMVRRDAWLYLFYEGKDGIGVARAPSINGPWKKPKTNPLIKGGARPTVFETARNELRVLYTDAGSPVVAGVRLDAAGWPTVERGSRLPPR